MPENAYLSNARYGTPWQCERGYRPERNTCEQIILPENAHLSLLGNDWDCDRPYRQVNGGCEAR